jgi:hypothetical protein
VEVFQCSFDSSISNTTLTLNIPTVLVSEALPFMMLPQRPLAKMVKMGTGLDS